MTMPKGRNRRKLLKLKRRAFRINNKRGRPYFDPAYSQWRASVRKRDRGTCQFPGCGSKRKVQVHHIKKWADFPSLRYAVSNGICLCRKCHEHIHGHEESYAPRFMRILAEKELAKIKDKKERLRALTKLKGPPKK